MMLLVSKEDGIIPGSRIQDYEPEVIRPKRSSSDTADNGDLWDLDIDVTILRVCWKLYGEALPVL